MVSNHQHESWAGVLVAWLVTSGVYGYAQASVNARMLTGDLGAA